jgi:hypothetical protein
MSQLQAQLNEQNGNIAKLQEAWTKVNDGLPLRLVLANAGLKKSAIDNAIQQMEAGLMTQAEMVGVMVDNVINDRRQLMNRIDEIELAATSAKEGFNALKDAPMNYVDPDTTRVVTTTKKKSLIEWAVAIAVAALIAIVVALILVHNFHRTTGVQQLAVSALIFIAVVLLFQQHESKMEWGEYDPFASEDSDELDDDDTDPTAVMPEVSTTDNKKPGRFAKWLAKVRQLRNQNATPASASSNSPENPA